MSSTTLPSTEEPSTSDPSLAALTPLPTRGRSALLLLVATVLLVGAWFSPDLLRPGLDTTGYAGASVALPEDGTVLTILDISAVAPLGGTVTSVGDVAGATVLGAWVLQPAPAEMPTLPWESPGRLTSDEVLAEAYGPGGLDASALPQPFTSGPVQIVVLWKITDCGALVEGAEAPMTVTNLLGMSFEETLPEFAGPDQGRGPHQEEGVCPPSES